MLPLLLRTDRQPTSPPLRVLLPPLTTGVLLFLAGPLGESWLLLAIGVGVLGSIACVVTELLIARLLPRVGELPQAKTRTTTAALTGVLCLALATQAGMNWASLPFLALAVLSVQLGRIDILHHLLPNPLVLASLVLGAALFALDSYSSADWAPMLRGLSGAAILFLFYLALAFISPSGIGMGDVKLAASVGLHLSYLGWTELFYGGALAFVLGGISSAVLLALKRVSSNAEIPFGPFMLGTTLCFALFSL